MKKLLLVVILPKFADWETAFLTSTIKSIDPDYEVKYVSIEKGICTSIGGLRVNIDYTVQNTPKEFSGLVLVGGLSWRTKESEAVMALVNTSLTNKIPMGAICDATVFLGINGILNNIKHTSNTLTELKSYAKDKYTNKENYINEQAVVDNNIITANGTAALEFTKLMLSALGVMRGKQLDDYYYFMKNGIYKSIQQGIKIPFK
ncbi:DJ-1/PfpI family protein [Pectinatus frisingensis]|jgi:putative intracellular protease/amidase|uniref:DJ-1/PfpI family protein n=1 Tax=Pectinatus frisingensis TaxID=865 RepID=UPI0018C5DFF5|nr:DJ-1/PfpI family protein [Pectinatus frisingensis]